MYLYYDTNTQLFSLSDNGEKETVFETYRKEERVGRRKGVNSPIEIGHFMIDIKTNFYPKSPRYEYIAINVFVDGVKLLPLSMACRKADVNYYLGKDNISFQQYGAGNNKNKEPATIVLLRENANWSLALHTVCDICNNYEEWIGKETRNMISFMTVHGKIGFCEISKFIDMVRVYDIIAPSLIPVYRQFIGSRCIEAMKDLLEHITTHKMKENDKKMKFSYGYILWRYIEDYYSSGEMCQL